MAIGWFLAPALPDSPINDIFQQPTVQQERQILRDERAVIGAPQIEKALEKELYSR